MAQSNEDRFSDSGANHAAYRYRVTYGMDTVGDTFLAAVVPEGAEVPIASRFPYMTTEQLRDMLASTELQSVHVPDDGSGWARLDLYAAAGGYGAFDKDDRDGKQDRRRGARPEIRPRLRPLRSKRAMASFGSRSMALGPKSTPIVPLGMGAMQRVR